MSIAISNYYNSKPEKSSETHHSENSEEDKADREGEGENGGGDKVVEEDGNNAEDNQSISVNNTEGSSTEKQDNNNTTGESKSDFENSTNNVATYSSNISGEQSSSTNDTQDTVSNKTTSEALAPDSSTSASTNTGTPSSPGPSGTPRKPSSESLTKPGVNKDAKKKSPMKRPMVPPPKPGDNSWIRVHHADEEANAYEAQKLKKLQEDSSSEVKNDVLNSYPRKVKPFPLPPQLIPEVDSNTPLALKKSEHIETCTLQVIGHKNMNMNIFTYMGLHYSLFFMLNIIFCWCYLKMFYIDICSFDIEICITVVIDAKGLEEVKERTNKKVLETKNKTLMDFGIRLSDFSSGDKKVNRRASWYGGGGAFKKTTDNVVGGSTKTPNKASPLRNSTSNSNGNTNKSNGDDNNNQNIVNEGTDVPSSMPSEST